MGDRVSGSGRFDGKVAIVTGSAGGIGEGYARALASEGAPVVVADIDLEGAERVAKSGVNGLTIQLAHELGGSNIRINAIAPGPIDTEAARSVVPPSIMDGIIGGLAFKRQGTPDDLASMCLFLMSDEASWITGQIFNVDGGQVVRA